MCRRTLRTGPLTCFSFPSFHRSPICSRPGKCFDHLFQGDLRRVVMDRVDLLPAPKAFIDLFHSLQPVQGRFSHIVSGYVKCDLVKPRALSVRTAEPPGCRQKRYAQDHEGGKDKVPPPWKTHLHYLRMNVPLRKSGLPFPSRDPLNVLRPPLPTVPGAADRDRIRFGRTCSGSGFSCNSAGDTPRPDRTPVPG
jgi:hypothetical protein